MILIALLGKGDTPELAAYHVVHFVGDRHVGGTGAAVHEVAVPILRVEGVVAIVAVAAVDGIESGIGADLIADPATTIIGTNENSLYSCRPDPENEPSDPQQRTRYTYRRSGHTVASANPERTARVSRLHGPERDKRKNQHGVESTTGPNGSASTDKEVRNCPKMG